MPWTRHSPGCTWPFPSFSVPLLSCGGNHGMATVEWNRSYHGWWGIIRAVAIGIPKLKLICSKKRPWWYIFGLDQFFEGAIQFAKEKGCERDLWPIFKCRAQVPGYAEHHLQQEQPPKRGNGVARSAITPPKVDPRPPGSTHGGGPLMVLK